MMDSGRSSFGLVVAAVLAATAPSPPAVASQSEEGRRFPHILVVTVDTLRVDRLSIYGCPRPLTPNLDRLLERGAIFRNARVVEPLTNPALASMFTSLYPHEHGATRNGLKMRPGLNSLPKILDRRGYKTAAFVSNWTLRDRLSGLGEHFELYEEILTRKRWFGLFKGEATAEDVTARALAWLRQHLKDPHPLPFFLWVHYVEPHAPYVFHREFAGVLEGGKPGNPSKQDRYDTEVAFTDHHIGRLLEGLEALEAAGETLIFFTADHGESLGEHDYWGHGRHVYDVTLRVPMGVVWAHRIRPRDVPQLALNFDLAPTVLGLLGLPVPEDFRGFDWSPLLLRGEDPPEERIGYFQAHKGAILSQRESEAARRWGLLEVAVLQGHLKEVLRLGSRERRLFDLAEDPEEVRSVVELESEPSPELEAWFEIVQQGLIAADEMPPPPLDAESVEKLRSLGYVD